MKEKVQPGGEFDYRPGINAPQGLHTGWAGMMPDLDPGSLPFNNLALGLNVRYDAGQVRSRWGFRQFDEVPMGWPNTAGTWDGAEYRESVIALATHHMQHNVPRLWILSQTYGDFGTVGLAKVDWYNPDANPSIGEVGQFNASPYPQGMGRFSGDMYMFSGGALRRLFAGRESSGATPLVGGITSNGFCLQEFGGRLYIGADYYYDGVSVIDSGIGANNVVNLCPWRDSHLVAVSVDGYSDYWYVDADGTWTMGALPSVMGVTYRNNMAEFRDTVFVASGLESIFAIVPGVSAVEAHAVTAGGKVNAIAVLGDVMYYAWSISDGSTWDSYIGLFDPDAASGNWNDTYKLLDTDLDVPVGELSMVSTMVAYRNALYIGAYNSVCTHELPFDPTSTWYLVNAFGNEITALKVGG